MQDEKKRMTILLSALGLVVVLYVVLEVLPGESNRVAADNLDLKPRKTYSLATLEAMSQKAIELKQGVPKYAAPNNDPFGGYELLKLTRREEKPESNQAKAPVQTQLRLLGIIWDQEKPYALVAHANGKSYDVVVGSVVEEEKILKISQGSIVTQREDTKFEITTSGYKKTN